MWIRLAVGFSVLEALSGCVLFFPQLDPPEPPPELSTEPRIGAGLASTCAIPSEGRLFCWGSNRHLQLGIASSDPEITTPIEVKPGSGWRSVSVGREHVCAIDSRADLWCWGNGGDGQIGDGAQQDSAPIQIDGHWVRVAAGGHHTCGIRDDGALVCWGDNSHGQLGDGTVTPRLVPTVIAGESLVWKDVTAGEQHTCAVDSSDRAWCWGENDRGQLGDGTFVQRSTPAMLASSWKALATGDAFTCGILTTGDVQCWGDNRAGQLGGIPDDNRTVPTAVATNAETIARGLDAAETHVCVVFGDDTMRCWGDATGFGGSGIVAVVEPFAGTPWRQVATGHGHTCVLDATNKVACVGAGDSGQLGNGSGAINVPTQVLSPDVAPAHPLWDVPAVHTDTLAYFDTGLLHTCGISSGALYCWGRGLEDELGDGARARRLTPVATKPGGWAAVGAELHTCALDPTRKTVACWGDGSVPSATSGILLDQIAVGTHVCAHDTSSNVQCWGSNTFGQLGTGDHTDATIPFKAAGPNASLVTVGATHSCARIGADVFCWGNNRSHQLGQISTPDAAEVSVPSLLVGNTVLDIVAGDAATCEIDTMNQLFCWGSREDGTGSASATPLQVPGNWLEVAVGSHHFCGIKLVSDTNAGPLFCWGQNERGQLGDGTLTRRATPVQIGTEVLWNRVVAGHEHTCATKADQTMWCWGENGDGQLGMAAGWTTTLSAVPFN